MPMPVGIVVVCGEPACRYHPESRNSFAALFSYLWEGDCGLVDSEPMIAGHSKYSGGGE